MKWLEALSTPRIDGLRLRPDLDEWRPPVAWVLDELGNELAAIEWRWPR